MKLLIILITINLNASLTETQTTLLKIAKVIGKNIKYQNMTFEKTLPAIMLQESSAKLGTIGDDKEKIYYYNHKGKQVKIKKSETFIENNKRYYKFIPIKNVYIKKVHNKLVYKDIKNSSIGPYQIKLSTARLVIRKLKIYKYADISDDRLITLLMYNVRFSSMIAGNYLKLNYIRAKNRGFKSPWKATVSHYNGGWYNNKYINNVKKRMIYLKDKL